jgi:CubicO group peptidase (beta-lactamase class C family)
VILSSLVALLSLSASAPDVWKEADPATLGMDVQAVREHERLCERTGADACLVVQGDSIVSEFRGRGFRLPLYAMSSTKSVTSLLVGMLIADGKIAGLDEPVHRWLPSWNEGDKARVRLRHLLTHTSGLARRSDRGENGSVGFVRDKNAHVVRLPLSWAPGTRFAYSNEGVQLLSPILDAAAGEPIQHYARRRLFEPLGMRDTGLNVDEKGHAWTYADMKTTPRDLARLGVLMLRGGSWQGTSVVPKAWIERATSIGHPLSPHHGLLWWILDEPRGFAARGHLDTNLYVFPGLDLVVVRMQARPSGREGAYEREALALFRRMVSDVPAREGTR